MPFDISNKQGVETTPSSQGKGAGLGRNGSVIGNFGQTEKTGLLDDENEHKAKSINEVVQLRSIIYVLSGRPITHVAA